jgi:hypothetical protein
MPRNQSGTSRQDLYQTQQTSSKPLIPKQKAVKQSESKHSKNKSCRIQSQVGGSPKSVNHKAPTEVADPIDDY